MWAAPNGTIEMATRRLPWTGALAATVLSFTAALRPAETAADAPGVAIPETVVLEPGSFIHPLAGEFLKAGMPVPAPRVKTAISRPLEIMKYEVSASDYALCVKAGACRPAEGAATGDMPVVGVSHLDAETYADWYSRETGESWRLPTDEEWAFAAAEDFTPDIESGDTNAANPALRGLARYRAEAALGRRPDPKPRPRGSFGTNSKGLADLKGNVWEWTSSCYVRATVDELGRIENRIDNCGVRVVEGFHRTYMSDFIREGKSGACAVGTPPDNLGFRLVREKPGFLRKFLRLG